MESGKGGKGRSSGSRSNSSGPTPKAKVLKTTNGGSMSISTRKETKAKEKVLKEVKVFVNGSSMDAKQDSVVASANVVTESGIVEENGVVEESISASEAIIRSPFFSRRFSSDFSRFESETAAFASSGVKSSVEVIGEICEGER